MSEREGEEGREREKERLRRLLTPERDILEKKKRKRKRKISKSLMLNRCNTFHKGVLLGLSESRVKRATGEQRRTRQVCAGPQKIKKARDYYTDTKTL